MSTMNVLTRAGLLSAAVAASGILGAGVASAHVTANVYGDQPQKGGYGAIFLRVPNEEADAGTTKVEVTVKPEYGISSARVRPVPGWTAEVTKTKLPAPVKNGAGADVTEVVNKISWTAQPGNKIAAGATEFQEFEISAGPLPSNVDTLELPAAQTYENGTVVNWNEPTPPHGQEPEHPAPTVTLAAAEGGHGHAHGAAAGPHDADKHDDESSDETARWLGGAGLVVGALGLGAGIGAILRGRRAGAATGRSEGGE